MDFCLIHLVRKDQTSLNSDQVIHSFTQSPNKDLLTTYITSLAQFSYVREVNRKGEVPTFMNLQRIHPKYSEQRSKIFPAGDRASRKDNRVADQQRVGAAG